MYFHAIRRDGLKRLFARSMTALCRDRLFWGSLVCGGMIFAAHPASAQSRPPRYSHTFHRAGHPEQISRYARPTDSQGYEGSYVGGSAVIGGEARRPEEGTWGRDYRGLLFRRRIWLGWWHGRKSQGGPGAYATDGPKLIHHE